MASKNAIREYAKGQSCTLRIYGVCNGDWSTTVLAHGRGAGMGVKLRDYIGCHACSACHAYLDSCSSDEFDRHFPRALFVTLGRLLHKGLVADPKSEDY